jgi:hypothetical protein
MASSCISRRKKLQSLLSASKVMITAICNSDVMPRWETTPTSDVARTHEMFETISALQESAINLASV